MPTIISHGFFAVVTGRMFSKAVSLKFVTLSVLCSILPDADVVGFSLGVPYGSVLGHRGFSHSLVFALLVAVFVVLFAFRETRRFTRAWWSLLGYFFVVTASHGVLDAATDGGLGVGFLLPFDSARYFFPFRPVHVAPISVTRFFSSSGRHVLFSELLWIWIPSLLLAFCVRLIRSRARR